MKYRLSNARIEDKQIIYRIKRDSIIKYVEEIWGWNEEFQKRNFEDDFDAKNHKMIFVEDMLAGFLEINETDTNINITEIHLIPNFQGQGIGSEIINNVINQAKKSNKNIEIGCFIKNAGAKRLYLNLGFKIIQETKTHFIFRYDCSK